MSNEKVKTETDKRPLEDTELKSVVGGVGQDPPPPPPDPDDVLTGGPGGD